MFQGQPKHSALDHLEGMPPYLMMQLEARLKVRLKAYLKPPEVAYCGITNLPRLINERPYTDDECIELAHHILHRMMEKRINDGRQFDSILECSRKAFAQIMFEHQLGLSRK